MKMEILSMDNLSIPYTGEFHGMCQSDPISIPFALRKSFASAISQGKQSRTKMISKVSTSRTAIRSIITLQNQLMSTPESSIVLVAPKTILSKPKTSKWGEKINDLSQSLGLQKYKPQELKSPCNKISNHQKPKNPQNLNPKIIWAA